MVFVGFAAGLLLLVKGAGWLIDAAVWIAQVTRVPKVVIGATLISLGTTLPEFTVSFLASATGYPDVALGNAVGSAIANIGLVLGLTVLMRARAIDRRLFRTTKGILMLGAPLLITLMARDGLVSRFEALILLAVLVAFISLSLRTVGMEQSEALAQGPDLPTGSIRHQLLLGLAGATMVGVGSRLVVINAAVIAAILGIPPLVVGLTLISLGTSLPELVTGVTATLKGHYDISFGNILGANFLNFTWVIGTAALVRPLPVLRHTQTRDLPSAILLTVMLLFLALSKDTLSQWEGGLLLLFYAGYIAAVLVIPA
jgi:cation:H+ antiporter